MTDEGTEVAEKVEMPELAKVDIPMFEFPEFEGKRVAIVHTCNLIGELEPCG